MLYGELRQHLGEVLRDLARQRECRVEEGHLLADHVHMLVSIPPKCAVSQVVGYIKGIGEQIRRWPGRAPEDCRIAPLCNPICSQEAARDHGQRSIAGCGYLTQKTVRREATFGFIQAELSEWNRAVKTSLSRMCRTSDGTCARRRKGNDGGGVVMKSPQKGLLRWAGCNETSTH